jgi:outer membrane receptor for ferrienterochelin and colicins
LLYRPLILFTCTFSFVCAQEIIQLDKISVEENYSVIEERKENSIAKRIIQGEELTQYGDMNALEMLQRTPGVTIAQGKGKKGAPGKGYTKVLIDGEEISGTKRGNPLEHISPDMIERLEVMTNGSAEYSAESMGGIVNIVLKKPASEGKTLAKLTVGAYEGEPMVSVFAQREGKSGKLSYLINTTISDNSQNDASSSHTDTYVENSENDTRYRSLSLNTKLIYTPSSKDKYMFDGALNRSDYRKENIQVRTTPQTITQHDAGDALMIWSKLSGTHNLSDTELVEWKLKYHENDSQGTTRTDNGTTINTQEDEGSFRVFGAEGSYSIALDEHFIKTGAEIKRLHQRDDVMTTGTIVSDEHQRLREDKGSWYIQDEISVGEKMVVTPGVRFERSVRRFDQNIDTDYVAPSLHALYKLSENDNLRASVAKTVKLPRLSELSDSLDSSLDENDINHPDITGNPNLKVESALSYEVRYEHFFEDKGIMSIGGFYRNINDKIEKLTTYDSGTGRYTERPENAGEGKLWSLELELKKSLERYVSGLGVFGNASVQHTSLLTNGVKRTIKGTHDYLYNIGIDHRIEAYALTYGAAYRYVSGYDDPIDLSGIAEAQEGYGTLDLYAKKRLGSTYKLGLNLKNITQETITTTSKRYSSGVLSETQIDREKSRFHFLVTLEGRW